MKSTILQTRLPILKMAITAIAITFILSILCAGGHEPSEAAAAPSPTENARPALLAPPSANLASPSETTTITYTYDAAGRLVQADYGEGRGVTFGYDDAGNLLRREVTGDSYPAYLPVVLR
jgi:YD repeat-containing protein